MAAVATRPAGGNISVSAGAITVLITPCVRTNTTPDMPGAEATITSGRGFVIAAAASLGAVAVLTACGSSSKSTGAAAASQQAAAPPAALKYARCMRSNGVPSFPDPDVKGRFGNIGHQLAGSPGYQAARQACRNLAPGGVHQAGDPGSVSQLRVFAQCMRANGIPQFPDPDANGGFPPGTEEIVTSSPNFQVALRACFSKLPNSMQNHSGAGG